jgi:OmpA-OmpF porin, OOP family
VVPSVVVTRGFGPVRLDARVGYHVREAGQFAQLVAQDGWVYALGTSIDLPAWSKVDHWKAIAEIDGAWPRGADFSSARYRSPLSARAGVRVFVTPSTALEVGFGTGLGSSGYGHERWRVFAGIRFGSPPRSNLGPPEDRDGDGVLNEGDLCPDDPGTAGLDGCPDEDGDDIPKGQDKCPDKPGPAENDGCPLDADDEPLIEIGSQKLLLKDAIHFDTGKDTISSESFPVLDQVAKFLKEHPDLKRIRVEGHTDNVGNAGYNKDLSGRRAASVVRYLVGKGVEKGRLIPAGFGFEQPIASNATALGRAKNRRVAFTILEEGPAP